MLQETLQSLCLGITLQGNLAIDAMARQHEQDEINEGKPFANIVVPGPREVQTLQRNLIPLRLDPFGSLWCRNLAVHNVSALSMVEFRTAPAFTPDRMTIGGQTLSHAVPHRPAMHPKRTLNRTCRPRKNQQPSRFDCTQFRFQV